MVVHTQHLGSLKTTVSTSALYTIVFTRRHSKETRAMMAVQLPLGWGVVLATAIAATRTMHASMCFCWRRGSHLTCPSPYWVRMWISILRWIRLRPNWLTRKKKYLPVGTDILILSTKMSCDGFDTYSWLIKVFWIPARTRGDDDNVSPSRVSELSIKPIPEKLWGHTGVANSVGHHPTKITSKLTISWLKLPIKCWLVIQANLKDRHIKGGKNCNRFEDIGSYSGAGVEYCLFLKKLGSRCRYQPALVTTHQK